MSFSIATLAHKNGVPLALNADPINEGDSIKHAITDRQNAEVYYKLPNGKPMPQEHPEWIQDTDLHIVDKDTTLQIIYMDEGAGYRNSIGYFVYETERPPQSIEEVGTIIIVFANGSGLYKGGSLVAGDTVQLPSEGTIVEGNFEPTSYVFRPGQSIGWVLIANGWTGSSVNDKQPIYFSNSALNPEKSAERRHHTVAVKATSLPDSILCGFEDLNRDGRTDDDFNDFVFFVKPGTFTSIRPDSYHGASTEKLFGTIICNDEVNFDDQYNDCDYNDLIASYKVDIHRPTETTVSEIDFTLHFKHRGAWADHEFGLLLPALLVLDPRNVQVTRETFHGDSKESIVEDLTESALQSGRLQFCDHSKQLLPPNPDCGGFCNTYGKWYTAEERVQPSSVRMVLKLLEPVDQRLFDDGESELIVAYLNTWPSGTVGEKPEEAKFCTSLDRFAPPPMLAGSGLTAMRPIYVLGGCESFRPCLEKHSIHHVYHRFTAFALSDEREEQLWWDNFREEELAIETIPDPVRVWTTGVDSGVAAPTVEIVA